jgi:uncharacterized protein
VEIMLLEFTVENYRSIKEPVTLSAVAQKAPKRKASAKTKRGVKSDAEICPGFPVEGWDMELLPVMAIFGANASGKSNVLQALYYLMSLLEGDQLWDELYPYLGSHTPFRLDKIYPNQPTKFDLHVAQLGIIFRYHIEIIGRKVYKESLEYLIASTKRSRQMFSREWSDQASDYIWENASVFSGSHIQLEPTLKENELFMSLLRRLKVDVISPFVFFLNTYASRPLTMTQAIERDLGVRILLTSKHDPELKDKVVDFIRRFDVGIIDLEFENLNDFDEAKTYAIHQNSSGETIRWRFEEESVGTQKLFSFATDILISLQIGGVILIDELGTNLHPKITSYIIQLFQNPKTNPRGAQLIFTSHDNTLQRNQLLRRDQIWFTEKKSDQSTDLYSLADFKVRNDLAIDKAYLDGRFGAVPFLPETVEELLGVD